VIDVHVEAPVESARRWLETVRDAVTATLEARGVGVAEISVTMLDDDAIRTLNRDHLEHDWATDVLSFALYVEGEPVLGDVYLGVEQAARQAAEEGVPLAEELARLAVHGTLHVLGFDHPEEPGERAASEMYRVQEEIVRGLTLREGSS
jgi:probable rRNA maturation factor